MPLISSGRRHICSGLLPLRSTFTLNFESGDTYTDHTHSYTETVVAPTCTEDGYTLHECACGHSYQDNTVAKLGHNYVKTREDLQYAYYRCTRCGNIYKTGIVIISPIDPNPPISQYSLDDDAAASSNGCTTRRVLKSTVTEEHSYTYASGKLLRETITGNGATKTLDFRYDNAGFPYALIYNNGSSTATYYYITNLQGDVMYLVDGNGNRVAEYTYDPYGKVLSSSGAMAEINPLRYRGYYQDDETGFYYLQSRYYDPTICRFINADSYASTGQSYLGYNTFAYCGNNPVNRTDADGEFWDIVLDVISLGFSIAEVIQNPSDPMAWAGLAGDVVDVAVPFVSGVGEATKAAGAVADVADAIDDVHDAARVMDNADDAYDAMKVADGVGDTLGSAKDVSKLDLDNAATVAKKTDPNAIGKAGEEMAGIDPSKKQIIEVNGRKRIPDALDDTTLTEVKNVKYISNTQQLRDFADYAAATGRTLELWVRPTTKVAKTVIDAGWHINYLW